MKTPMRRGYVSSVVWLAGMAVSGAAISGAALLTPSSPNTLVDGPGLHELSKDLTYLGSGSCTGSGCHSGEAKKWCDDKMIGDENGIWQDKDPHNRAFKSLTNDKGKKIAAAMKIDNATTSAKCTVCHAMDAPKKGEKFKDIAKEGVGCESCHGPAEKWKEPHQKKCWTKDQRAAGGAKGLWANHGLFDTTDLVNRATMCVSCHMQIDKELLDAGHPALEFEMYSYNNYKFLEKYQIHWSDPATPALKAQMWAVGQVVTSAAAEGAKDKNADLVKVFAAGKAVAKAHFGSDDAATLAKTAPARDKIVAAAGALAAAAGDFKGNKLTRNILTAGVDALVSASMEKDAPDAYFDALDAAGKAEGDAWVEAVKKMAGFAK